ncbi:hypothetical protein [Bradyrhizobium cytisi]|uniref:Uncharacterized protein n=1 Tax=Bradyrhizobium cytisi TaxID=515489 RepID=A0A5S4X0C7_9BRAD|nr:hypothetical protein [Bradyrhizobium cytisi]TYL87033.1 hypothetical protein FXB38_05325 [Bradyrhizobium cytisi]
MIQPQPEGERKCLGVSRGAPASRLGTECRSSRRYLGHLIGRGALLLKHELTSISDDYQSAWCDWFVQDKPPWKQEHGVFSMTSLKLIG